MQTSKSPPPQFKFDNKPHLLIVEARFYEDISDHLFAGAQEVLDANEASYDRLEVPGSLEIPAAINFAVKALDYDPIRRRFDGYIALGCVIKGETRHDEIVGNGSARGLQELALRSVLAIGNGILTVDSHEQALARATVDGHNRGGAAAAACLRMIEIKQHFRLMPKRRWVAKS
ncbi:MAG: 6,7-dimethyl-8-ribityllumazine synthase [Alphaproteobacteria bacterium]